MANDVAIKVIEYRVRHGLSQAQLAAKLGMRQPHVARLESGDQGPSLATLSRLADALGLDSSIEVKRNRVPLRYPARSGSQPERAVRRGLRQVSPGDAHRKRARELRDLARAGR